MAKGMPRRRVLRLLAGGLAAAVGTSIASLSAVAGNRHGKTWPHKPHDHKDHIGVNQTMPRHPGVNQTMPRPPAVNQTMPRPPAVNQTIPSPPGVNQTIPQWYSGW